MLQDCMPVQQSRQCMGCAQQSQPPSAPCSAADMPLPREGEEGVAAVTEGQSLLAPRDRFFKGGRQQHWPLGGHGTV
jgi:hypothetical protein